VAALPIPDLTPALPAILFYTFSLLAIASAILAATATKIVHAAFGLLAAFFGVAGLYGLLGADFLAFSQVLIYIGGILVLLVFGVLLTGRIRGTLGLEKPERLGAAVAVGGLLLFGLLLALGATDFGEKKDLSEPTATTAAIGRALLDPEQALVPFEVVSGADRRGLPRAPEEGRMTITLMHYLTVAAMLFSAGVVTVLVRRNAIAILIGIELMLNAANLNLVAFDRFGPSQIRGQIFALLVLAIAAAEAAVALAIVLNVFDSRDRIDVDEVKDLEG
jgi:NADH:ubiquinone oxidoreductase subunit K/NADH:ubiquinone oxidoreductase subunit 6 (subunit J)